MEAKHFDDKVRGDAEISWKNCIFEFTPYGTSSENLTFFIKKTIFFKEQQSGGNKTPKPHQIQK